MNPKNKVALITGGAHRVGKAMTMMLAEAGAHVVVNYNQSQGAAERTVAEAAALGVQACAIQANIANWGQVQQMSAQIIDQFGGVDIIINAASLFGRTQIPTDDIDAWHQVTRISVDGAFYVCNCLVPSMIERIEARNQANNDSSTEGPEATSVQTGAIINIVDLSVWKPWKNLTAHAVGKSALLALTRQLALELAPTIRVNAIAPGPVLPPPDYNDRKNKMVAKRTLLNRWGTPADVTHAVSYLIEAEYVTGDVLRVDGGEFYKG